MGKGYLKVSVTTGSGALPVAGANVTVADAQGNILYRLVTDEDGNTGKVEINAPDKAVDLDPDYVGDYYAVCDVKIEAENYDTVIVNGVQIFDTVTTILPVNMAPVLEEGAQPEYAVRIDIPAPAIISEEHTHQSNGQTRQDPAGITPAIQGDVKIPERIRVQQGAPNAIANVVSVTFPDYIKNVCSSEIFPTWPDASLEANIYCQISLALNRIFTEWYPSQGKYFDITNNTGWDQAFTYGRNIYDNISVMVDRIFNRFVRREGHKEPFYTEYCDGKKATCPGLKQWGTVDLANRGYTPIQILRYYYPKDIQLVETNNIAPVQESYPGYPLS
ncbi:MAG: hypothetical protein FWF44_09640, partial [Defluviitaleaceae bacterium]|nr:hypothetical protein [Defluviitaleaceae bacterium]